MSGIETAFLGTLGKNAESKVSGSGKAYLRLNVRVGDGDSAQWISVMAFDQDAIDAADKLTAGARVYVEGRLSINEWTGKDGAKRAGLSVMSWHCRLSQIGRNRPKRDQQKPKQNFPRDMHAPLDSGAADINDDIPEWSR
jgi:single-stranded DNA-binding protein